MLTWELWNQCTSAQNLCQQVSRLHTHSFLSPSLYSYIQLPSTSSSFFFLLPLQPCPPFCAIIASASLLQPPQQLTFGPEVSCWGPPIFCSESAIQMEGECFLHTCTHKHRHMHTYFPLTFVFSILLSVFTEGVYNHVVGTCLVPKLLVQCKTFKLHLCNGSKLGATCSWFYS